MLAFTVPIGIAAARTSSHFALATNRRPNAPLASPPSLRVVRAAFSADEQADPSTQDPAVVSGQPLRDQLDTLTRDRQKLQEDTNKTLTELSAQLNTLMAKMREEAGMPPVADPPASDELDSSESGDEATAASPQLDVSAADDGSSSADEPYMDPQNFGYESTAGWQVLAESLQLPDNEGNVEFRIECDTQGCSIIEVKGDAATPSAGVRKKFIQSFPGLRVGYDPEAPRRLCGMVGTEQWAVALNYEEIRHFSRLCTALERKMRRIGSGEEKVPAVGEEPSLRRSGDGMHNVRVTRAGLDYSVELESKVLWVQAIGQPIMGQYCVRAIFIEGRQCEAFWGPEVIVNLMSAVKKLGVE